VAIDDGARSARREDVRGAAVLGLEDRDVIHGSVVAETDRPRKRPVEIGASVK
jgi:hypothetical protein